MSWRAAVLEATDRRRDKNRVDRVASLTPLQTCRDDLDLYHSNSYPHVSIRLAQTDLAAQVRQGDACGHE